MKLMKRTLLRAPAAVTQQLRGLMSVIETLSMDEDQPKVVYPKKDNTKTTFKDRCWASMRRSEFKCRSDLEFNLSAWIDAQKNCLEGRCVTAYPPSDLTLYKPSDKLNRVYKRTWCECELQQPKKKAVCLSRPITYERRSRPIVEDKRCPKSSMDLGLGPCGPKLPGSCPRFKLPFCKEANTKGCQPGRLPDDCVKRRTKYPSYSECQAGPVPDLVPTHCRCINQPPMCVVWNYYRMKKS